MEGHTEVAIDHPALELGPWLSQPPSLWAPDRLTLAHTARCTHPSPNTVGKRLQSQGKANGESQAG